MPDGNLFRLSQLKCCVPSTFYRFRDIYGLVAGSITSPFSGYGNIDLVLFSSVSRYANVRGMNQRGALPQLPHR